MCLGTNCKISGNNSVSNIKRAHRDLNSGCLTHSVKHLYRPACYAFHPIYPGMILQWGVTKEICKCQSGLMRCFQCHFRSQILHDTPPTCTLERADVACHLFCSFELLATSFKLWMWPSGLGWPGWMHGTPCHWEGNEKGRSKLLCVNVLYWSSTGCIVQTASFYFYSCCSELVEGFCPSATVSYTHWISLFASLKLKWN